MAVTVYTHPENVASFAAAFRSPERSEHLGIAAAWLHGIKVIPSKHLPRYRKRWVPPRGRFWECGESDAAWCRPLGLGRWEDTDEPYFLAVNTPKRDDLKPVEFFREPAPPSRPPHPPRGPFFNDLIT